MSFTCSQKSESRKCEIKVCKNGAPSNIKIENTFMIIYLESSVNKYIDISIYCDTLILSTCVPQFTISRLLHKFSHCKCSRKRS